MRGIGRNLMTDFKPTLEVPQLSLVEKAKKHYFDYQIKRCHKHAEKFGESSAGVDQLRWCAAVSKSSSYYYQVQALLLRAEIRDHQQRDRNWW